MKIAIKELAAQTLLGVYPEERLAPREVTLNIAIEYDAAKAARTDDVKYALDYAIIEERVVNSLAMQSFQLLEALAEHVAKLVLEFPAAKTVTVEIDKAGALVHAKSVSVTHTLSK